MINSKKRYQTGLTIGQLFPTKEGICACGCNRTLPTHKRKWFSSDCRDAAYIKFAIIKGDVSVIRTQIFLRDLGFCKNCGVLSDDWQADHIIPVIDGGGACDLSNLQTLCIDCHKAKHKGEFPVLSKNGGLKLSRQP